jgi:hypothetical protein
MLGLFVALQEDAVEKTVEAMLKDKAKIWKAN